MVSWRLSDSLESDFCVNNLEQALAVGLPNYYNSDQGSQFTASNYLETLQQYPNIQISMDGRGRCMDNIFTGRLWRTVKYHEVCLHGYLSLADAKQSLSRFFSAYNTDIPHQSLQGNVPADVYFEKIKLVPFPFNSQHCYT